jgi:hypothetical protein
MRHISLENQPEQVRQFVLALLSPDGALLELEGHPVACVLPAPKSANGPPLHPQTWTDAKNARRCDLIDRKYAGILSPAEAAELAALQEEMLRYRQHVAPLPLEDARRLHQELLRRAQESRGDARA